MFVNISGCFKQLQKSLDILSIKMPIVLQNKSPATDHWIITLLPEVPDGLLYKGCTWSPNLMTLAISITGNIKIC